MQGVDDVTARRRHLDRAGFDKVKVIPHDRGSFPATRLDPGYPMVRFATKAIKRAVGVEPDIFPNLGGSLPNDCFADVLGLPTMWVPHFYACCSQHAPDEHVLKSLSRQALLATTALFADWADRGLPQG